MSLRWRQPDRVANRSVGFSSGTEAVGDGAAEIKEPEWFLQDGGGSLVDDIVGIDDGTGDEEDRCLVIPASNNLHQFQTGHSGEVVIHNKQVEGTGIENRHCIFG